MEGRPETSGAAGPPQKPFVQCQIHEMDEGTQH